MIFTGASLTLLAIPGPAVLYLVARSVDQGRRAGLISMLGVETATFIYALAAAVGLTGMIAASETGFAAFLPQFVTVGAGPVAAQTLAQGAIFTALAIASDGAYVLLADALRGRLLASRRFERVSTRLTGSVYIGLGVTAALCGPTRGG